VARKDNLDIITSPAGREVLNDNFEYLADEIDGSEETYNDHVSGTAEKHAAEDVTFDSDRPSLTASDTKGAIEQVDERMDGLVNNPDPDKDLELVDFRTSSQYGVFDTAKERGDNIDNLFVGHEVDEKPHQFEDVGESKTYKYGFSRQDDRLVFIYEEVV
jgi:hypothetical protein